MDLQARYDLETETDRLGAALDDIQPLRKPAERITAESSPAPNQSPRWSCDPSDQAGDMTRVQA
jgi:hypothetical protein